MGAQLDLPAVQTAPVAHLNACSVPPLDAETWWCGVATINDSLVVCGIAPCIDGGYHLGVIDWRRDDHAWGRRAVLASAVPMMLAVLGFTRADDVHWSRRTDRSGAADLASPFVKTREICPSHDCLEPVGSR